MTHAPQGLEIRPVSIVPTIDSPDAADFVAMVEVRNAVLAEVNGHADESITPRELLAVFQPDEYQQRSLWLVLLDGVAVGRAGVDIPNEDGSILAFWYIDLLPAIWGRGIGSAVLELIEQTARAHGRTVLQAWTAHPAGEGPRIMAPTGFGSIPDDHAARFARRHGYTLEQVERNSALVLADAAPRLEHLLETAAEASAAYRVVSWQLPTPPEFVAGYAWMKSRMVTDAPSAEIEFDEEVWDAARLARHERPYLDAGRALLVTAAQHIDSGELCAFNELVIGNDRTEATHQEDTLVLKEHRGHRLGMRVKCAGLLEWRHIAPLSPRVLTYNAEENRPMLDINEAIGFAPIAYEGAWKKVLT
ncbi:GNAT family N-acetyltransferase [Microbacterium sp. P02]|uniref:GNAT family N-acetyltransferase n=1 Tax=Microbacterium sp. P02 TaxID=3366260 RepID=UPI003672FAE7